MKRLEDVGVLVESASLMPILFITAGCRRVRGYPSTQQYMEASRHPWIYPAAGDSA